MSEISDTWTWRELPVLRSALHRVDAGEDVQLDDVRVDAGLTGPQLRTALDALANASPPYLSVYLAGGWRDDYASGMIDQVFERTRRELGSWPKAETVVDAIAAALERAAEDEQQPEERHRLRAAAEALGGVARDLAVDIVAKQITG